MTYEKYFEFLEFSLVKDCPVPGGLDRMDWEELYDFGFQQALLGVLFLGIKKLPKGVAPPQKLLMHWIMMSDNIRKQSIKVSNTAVEVVQKFADDGFRCCVLKGQGNALMYDDFYSRTSGDIDVWMCGYANEREEGGFVYPGIKEMRKRVTEYAEQNFEVEHIISYHASFDYKGVEVETHFSPSMMTNPLYDKRFQQWCTEQAKEQSENYAELPDTGGGQIPVPTLYFNLIYQLDHIFRHFFDMGIGLRQLTDYYQLLLKYDGGEHNKEKLQRDLHRLGLRKIAGAVMWVLKEILHLPENKMIVAADMRRGKLLLAEILNGGNFGKYDKKYGGITRKGMAGKFFTKTVRNLSFVKYYPEEALCEPLFRMWHFFWRKAKGWI